MNILDMLNNMDYVTVYNKKDLMVTSFSIDSRVIKNESLYIGIIGESFNGNDFYKNAMEKGSICAVVSGVTPSQEDVKYLEDNNKTLIVVENTQEALRQMAVYKKSSCTLPVIAVTGSAGKTSTKDIIHSILKEKYNAFKTLGNKNNHLGLPTTLLNLKDEDIAVLEMGMNHFNEISYLTNIAKPNAVVLTNIGTAHIGNLGSRENILKAKLEILEALQNGGPVVINNDDDLLNEWATNNKEKYNIITYGISTESDIMPSSVTYNSKYTKFVFEGEKITVPIPGEHYLYNTLAAIAVTKVYGVNAKEIKNGVAKLELSSNRMELIESKGINYINDAYNANYDAMEYAIKHLASFEGRKIACLGTMKELGDLSEVMHKNLGENIVENNIDVLVTVGEYTNLINEEAEKLGLTKDNSHHFKNNNEAISFINKMKQEKDNILVKASASCKFLDIVKKIAK